MSKAIHVAISGDPVTIGELLVDSGQDILVVGRWVTKQQIERRRKELEKKA